MMNHHAKSPCCQAGVIRFGRRRRQCLLCRKTWRIRVKQRGRRAKRVSAELVSQYLRHELPSLYALSRATGKNREALRIRLIRSRNTFLRGTSWPSLPMDVPLILIADAMVCEIEGAWFAVYLMLIRPVGESQAIIHEPYIAAGPETAVGWYAAFATIPDGTWHRIQAIVCDGHRGIVGYAKRSGWLVQRCHFHLIAAIQGRRSRWARSRHRAMGERLYRLVSSVLTAKDPATILPLLTELETIAWDTRSRVLRKVLLGFVTHAEDYRTYLRHPELNLPRTSNTAEALISMIRHFCHRARGFSTRRSLEQWIAAIIKHKRTMTCNASRQPNYRV